LLQLQAYPIGPPPSNGGIDSKVGFGFQFITTPL
jgi:hypothetical protein